MRKLLVALFTFVAVGASAQDQHEIQKLSLADAQQYAISNNLTVRNTNLDLEKAKKKVWETAAQGMPQISATGTYQHLLSEIPMFDIGQMSGAPAGTAMVPMALRNDYKGSASLNQLIFSGSYIVGLQAAKTYKEFAQLGIEKSLIEINAAVSNMYYLCLLASEGASIMEENLVMLEKTLNEMRAMKEQGFLDRTSVDQLEVTFNIQSAQCNSLRRQIKNTRDMLKYVIGMPMNQEIELTDKLENIISGMSSDYVCLADLNQEENIDVKMAQMDVSLSKLQLKLAQSEYLPTLGAQLGISHSFTMPEFSFQQATTGYLGVSLNVPIFTSGKTSSKVQQAKISLQQSRNKELLARQNLDLEYQQATDKFILAWENYEIQKKNLKLAARVLEDMKKSLVVGMRSSSELVQANASYLEAVSGLITAENNLLTAKTQIDKILHTNN